jgi:hypothetical protein
MEVGAGFAPRRKDPPGPAWQPARAALCAPRAFALARGSSPADAALLHLVYHLGLPPMEAEPSASALRVMKPPAWARPARRWHTSRPSRPGGTDAVIIAVAVAVTASSSRAARNEPARAQRLARARAWQR